MNMFLCKFDAFNSTDSTWLQIIIKSRKTYISYLYKYIK